MSTQSPHDDDHNRHPDRAALAQTRAAITGRTLLRLNAAVVADATRTHAPGALLLELDAAESPAVIAPDLTLPRAAARVLAVGSPEAVSAHTRSLEPSLARSITPIDLPQTALLSGLVNAHTHLDLTRLGPQPHDPADGFVAWVDRVRTGRATESGDIQRSVERGIALSLAGGTIAVGDIAGAPNARPSLIPISTLRASPLLGVSYLETFGIGAGEPAARARLESILADLPAIQSAPGSDRVHFGLQPHAPNTVGVVFYEHLARLAAESAIPIATHLAETPEERAFIADAAGPQVELLQRFGYWTADLAGTLGRGLHPAEHLQRALETAPFTLAHLNDAPDAAIDLLARTNASVVYCPRASAYFAAETHFGPHRYRDLLAAGVRVALGTDSIVNLPAHAADPHAGGMSIFEEMALLVRRDSLPARVALGMATHSGIDALDPFETRHLTHAHVSLGTGDTPLGVLAVPLSAPLNTDDPLRDTILSAQTPQLLFCSR